MKLPLSGVFGGANSKYLPLWALGAGGIEISLSLEDVKQSMIQGALVGAGPEVTNSQRLHLEDIRLECNMITLDSSLQEQFSRNLMEGGSLMIHSKFWDCTNVFLGPDNAGNFDVSLSKSLSRLATSFFSFSEELTDAQIRDGTTYVNNFRMYDHCKETIESHVTVGSKRFPEFPVKSTQGHFWRLVSSLGITKSLPHSINVDVEAYKTNTFCIGADHEMVPLVASSGINTQGGQELKLHVKNMSGALAGANAAQTRERTIRRCWACLHYEGIIELRATGASLLT